MSSNSNGDDFKKALMNLVLPKLDRRPSYGRNFDRPLDYSSVGRKTFLVDFCDKCGTLSAGPEHPEDLCEVSAVMLS